MKNVTDSFVSLGHWPSAGSFGVNTDILATNPINLSVVLGVLIDHNGISVYTGTIISDWGGRLELEIDRKARIWARVSRKQKISILVLSSAMGSNLREILENVCYPEIFLSFLTDKEKKKIGSKENAILEFYQQFSCVGGDRSF